MIGFGSLFSQLSGRGNMESQALESFSNSVLNTPSNNAKFSYLNQQTNSPEDAATLLKNLAKEDDAYKELYIQLLAERENQERAYQWYEDFNKNYYQRTTEDLKKAGLNPWLALQSLGSGGTGSISPAGSWSGTSGSTKAGKLAEANQELYKQGLASAGTIIAAIAGAIIMSLL